MINPTIVNQPLAGGTVNINELDKLAKLLASENILIQHANVATASFNVDTRILELPVWKNMPRELYHMLILHEIGHALYTPSAEWTGALNDHPEIKDVINIIEDARIEKLVKGKYAGSRRDFRMGYGELYNRNFFRTAGQVLSKYSFADRINLFYKIGDHITVPFTNTEREILSEIDAAKLFSDSVLIAKKIYTSTKSSKDLDIIQSSAEGGALNEAPDDSAEEIEVDDVDTSIGTDVSDESETRTVTALEQSLQNLIDRTNNKRVATYYDLDEEFDENDYIIPFKYIIESTSILLPKCIIGNRFVTMRSKNIRAVDYLVKEFHLRKSADQYARSRQAKTGTINPNRLHAYTMIDDIFRRITVNPDAKNHGIVMFVDFSGSMHNNMGKVIEQLLCLVLFCRKVNIPHRVYSFGDGAPANRDNIVKRFANMAKSGRKFVTPDFNMRLLELFSNKMTSKDLRNMMEILLTRFNTPIDTDNYHDLYNNMPLFVLGGTPLQGAMMLARKILHKFKKETGTQIVSVVFLTDGEGKGLMTELGNCINNTNVVLRDAKTHKNYNISSAVGASRRASASILMGIIRNEGFNTINFRIGTHKDLKHEVYAYAGGQYNGVAVQLIKKLRTEKFVTLTNHDNFQEYYLIQDGNNLDVEDYNFTVDESASKAKITSAFIKAHDGRLNSRSILAKFAQKVAT